MAEKSQHGEGEKTNSDAKAESTIHEESEYRKSLTAEELGLVTGWEKAHGRKQTDQEIRRGLDELRSLGIID